MFAVSRLASEESGSSERTPLRLSLEEAAPLGASEPAAALLLEEEEEARALLRNAGAKLPCAELSSGMES